MSGFWVFTVASALSASPLATQPAPAVAADGNAITQAFEGQTLAFTMRGTSVTVIGSAAPAEQGCAALLSARAPHGGRRWSRLIRWSDLAWTSPAASGRVTLAFHDHEGRLATDHLAFQPVDPAGFIAAVNRLATGCREGSSEGARVLTAGKNPEQPCYFARLPGLQLIPAASTADRPRAVLNVLARETPEAELQLLLERAQPNETVGDDDWGRPVVAFTFADPKLGDMRIADAAFALDAKPVAARHALAAYGDTRVRISMDPQRPPVGGGETDSFYRRLAGSGSVSLMLLDGERQTKAVLNFEAGPVLAAARRALSAANWSCEGAAPALAPAAIWQPAP